MFYCQVKLLIIHIFNLICHVLDGECDFITTVQIGTDEIWKECKSIVAAEFHATNTALNVQEVC